MHPRNRHQDRYDLALLAKTSPELVPFIKINKYKDETIDFSDHKAVRALNKAILKTFYGITHWEIPENNLCPPIPGRADYIHTAADLFPKKERLQVLDIGTGANLIYPLIGWNEYQWNFVGSDIDAKSLANAQKIIDQNHLSEHITLRRQQNKQNIFSSIILPNEKFDLTLCNPPFHESLEEASQGTSRKWKNLKKNSKITDLNFGGQGTELWCPGGEKGFILKMIEESKSFGKQVKYFTTLVSKEANLPPLMHALEKNQALSCRILNMTQGQKKSRLLCWSFILKQLYE